jgi:hypothetical protein
MKKLVFAVGMLMGMGIAHAAQKPNVVVILADEWGWRDAGLTGSTFCETPAIDQLGRGGFHFTTGYAPLILGNDLRSIPDDILEIITNKEVIALDQDPLCKQGKIEYSKDGIQVWVKPLHNGDTGILILNRNNEPVDFALNFADAKLDKSTYEVRDLWAHKDLGKINKTIKQTIGVHGVKVYRLW